MSVRVECFGFVVADRRNRNRDLFVRWWRDAGDEGR